MSLTVIILVVAAVFIGALSRATFGFGEAVVSMPLLALLPIDLHTSISLIGLAGLIVALFTAISGWRYIDRPALIRLVIGALLGIPVGIVSGIMGSAYNTHGVPVVVYGTLKRWEPNRFRGTLQAHFLISGVFIVVGQALGGLWTKDLFLLFGASVPFVVIATLLGVFLHNRIPQRKFERYVYLFLVLLGALLLAILT